MNATDEKFSKKDYETQHLIAMGNTEMPESFSLGQYIPYTHNQGKLGSCTAMGPNVSMEIQNTQEYKEYKELMRKDLWSKMGHSIDKYDGGDDVKDALQMAVDEGIEGVDDNLYKADFYSYEQWGNSSNLQIKQTLYKGLPIVMVMQGNKLTRAEMILGEVKTTDFEATGGHCIALVGWDEGGFWFLNSRGPNDKEKKKSRFYITYDNLWKLFDNKKIGRRYFILTDKKQINTGITLERYKELVIAKANIEEIMPKLQTIIELPLVQTFKDETIGYVNVCSAKLKDIENELNKYK